MDCAALAEKTVWTPPSPPPSRVCEAISAYYAYCHFIDRGTLLVNAGDDPEDVVRGALLYVERCIGECRSLGLTDPEIYELVTGEPLTG